MANVDGATPVTHDHHSGVIAKLTGSVIPVTVFGWLLNYLYHSHHLANGWRVAFVIMWLAVLSGLLVLWFRQGWATSSEQDRQPS